MNIVHCCDDDRRAVVRALDPGEPDGIDFLEVVDHDAPPGFAQRLLRVTFVRGPAPALVAAQIRVDGGERIRPVLVQSVAPDAGDPRTLIVTVDRPGDFSAYTLRLVDPALPDKPPAGIDPALAAIDFSFKVECESAFDCLSPCACPAVPPTSPALDRLVKDEATFRRLLLDRFAQLVPEWSEAGRRNPADLGVTLLELFAHLADRLSYRQDAVATEATLRTARRRTSVRRHVRLVDYRMHEGCNARGWAQVLVHAGAASADLPAGSALATAIAREEGRIATWSTALDRAEAIFETMHRVRLVAAHEAMRLHTWHGRRCCLGAGATAATLAGHFPELVPGMFLLLAETRSAVSGLESEADASLRHVVRLTSVEAFASPGVPLVDPVASDGGGPAPVTEIAWHEEDALPFELCISAVDRSGADHDDVGMAFGNMVLADHGLTRRIDPVQPFAVVPPDVATLQPASEDRCDGWVETHTPARFRPIVPLGPVVHADAAPGLAHGGSATSLARRSAAEAVAALTLLEAAEPAPFEWSIAGDLLSSGPADRHAVLEIEHDGTATLRFGDGTHGRRPPEGGAFGLRARQGGGAAGNIGADTLRHVRCDVGAVAGVRNWLPAVGGIDREPVESARLRAPVAFRRQERAVTESDYVERTMEVGGLQQAAATFRWTGSWHTVFVTPDRAGGGPPGEELRGRMVDRLERTRLVGHDVALDAPRPVGIDLGLRICLQPTAFRADVGRSLMALFSRGLLPDGTPGLFHPDRFTFGQTVHLSPFVAAAQSVPGVASVQATVFRRVGDVGAGSLASARIELGRLEIARLDNDPSFPERGLLSLELGGGR